MTGNEIRKSFLDYFSQRQHTLVASSPLVPQNDPTLLFTNAGMVQFKNIFLGEETREYSRAVSSQKCVRAGGKHNDLEMVGRTARHHTFFEMLGNFSFGDYFKTEAIQYAWEYLTEVVKLPKEKLYPSVYKDDDEAFQIWNETIGIETPRIFRMDEKDNFWAMGNTGPCGPCSEIYIDQGEALGCGKATCTVGCDCDRYLEIWNLVFMQFDRDESGKLSPLPKPCIDTGMGLERLAAVVQGKPSNYDSDLIMGLIQESAEITGTPYDLSKESHISLKILVDHARATSFLISDGVLPSNEGRGYVLRRIMRRALRHGKLLEQKDSFFHKITDRVVEHFRGCYPELESHRSFINKVVVNEEESFHTTLTVGTQRLEEILNELKKQNKSEVPGEDIFKLYDTYGFPVDLAQETARDWGFSLDLTGYDRAMQEQKTKAMASWKGSGEKEVAPIFNEFLKSGTPTRFLGYQSTHGEGVVLRIIQDDQFVDEAKAGQTVGLLLDQTTFYGESGGQVGDTGLVYNDHVQLEITNTTKPLADIILHQAKVIQGTLKSGDTLTLEVDSEKRRSTALNHTSTHLLHSALKEVIGDHVKQAGSLVTPDRLRFDYTHFSPMTAKEQNRIETLVNEKIRDNIEVETDEMSIETAIEQGAVALFGEKYGNNVRVVNVPGFSKELCGGTHTGATGNIGVFKIVSETGIASGVRRLEAVTGLGAFDRIQNEFEKLEEIRQILKSPHEEELNRLQKLVSKNRLLEKEVAILKDKLTHGKTSSFTDDIRQINGTSVLVKNLEGMDAKTLRSFIDNAKNKMQSGVVVVGSAVDGKAILAAGVTSDLTKKYHAGNLLKEISRIVGGSGGGRPDMAQAGGTRPDHLDQALEKALSLLSEA